MPRSSSNSNGRRKTQPVKTKDPARAPSIRGEKRVKETDASIPVGPSRRARGTHDGPTDPVAIDQRKEFTGTDQPADPAKGKQGRQRAGGNAGRPAVGLPDRV